MVNTHKDAIANSDIINPKLRQLQQRLAHTLIDIEKTAVADASVLLVITNEAQPKLMLTRRASHMKSHAGEVSFPGGKHEPLDRTNIDTACRETHEETNLTPNCLQIIGQLKAEVSKSGLVVQPIVAIMPPEASLTEPLVAEVSEIARIFWVDFEWLITAPTQEYIVTTEARGIKALENKQQSYQKSSIETPCWKVDGETIWGLTGMITADMLAVGFDRQVAWYFCPVTQG